jgi:hypothetical protein
MTAKRRAKLSDLRAQGAHLSLFPQVDTFAEAYPTIKSLHVVITEREGGELSKKRTTTLTEANFKVDFDCSNRKCYGGGVHLGSLVHAMASSRETDYDGRHFCEGYEGSPQGRVMHRGCLHNFQVSIHIVYKDS